MVARSGLRRASTPCATVLRASMSRPESAAPVERGIKGAAEDSPQHIMAHRRPDGSGDGGLVVRCRFPPPGHALRATRDAFGRRAETDRFAWLSGTLKVRPRTWRKGSPRWLGPVRPLPARAGVWPTG